MSSGSLSGQQAPLQDMPLRTQLEAAEAEKGDLDLQVAEVGTAAPRVRTVWKTALQECNCCSMVISMRSRYFSVIAIIA